MLIIPKKKPRRVRNVVLYVALASATAAVAALVVGSIA
jgi:hypothetical protein